MKNPAQLVRTCLACGLEKPLAAFLQITGSQGTIYGNICSSCRSSTAKGKLIPQTDADEGLPGSSGLRIDAKRKLQTELEQKKSKKKLTEGNLEEKKKTDEASLEKTENIEKKQKAEKDHRTDYIEGKKKQQTFLDQGKKPADNKIIQKAQQQKNFIATHQQIIEAQKLEEAIEQEAKLTGIDTSQVFLDSQMGEIKFQSAAFKRFKAWLGESAHFSIMDRLQGKSESSAKKQATTPSTEKEDPLIDYVEKTAKSPTSRRR